ncbi:hypothetical protein L7F22_063378 [Adiantum nelumboides]|nr:hypothetical protein [Adiantum nelumboides]
MRKETGGYKVQQVQKRGSEAIQATAIAATEKGLLRGERAPSGTERRHNSLVWCADKGLNSLVVVEVYEGQRVAEAEYGLSKP